LITVPKPRASVIPREDFLNLRGRNSDGENLRFIPKASDANCSGLSQVILVQLTVEICVATYNLKQEVQLWLGKADRTAYFRSPASDFQSRKKSDLPEVTKFHARLVNGTLS